MANVTLKLKSLRRGTNSSVRANDWDDMVTVINAQTTLITELKTLVNLLQGQANNALQAISTLAISATAEEFKTTTTARVMVDGVSSTKAATDSLTFTLAHVVSLDKYGVILIQMTSAGVISTKVPLATQAYADAATALTNLPEPDADNVALGYITIQADGTAWTANTDDMTDASDLDAATFVDAGVVLVPRQTTPTASSATVPDTLVLTK